MPIPHVPSVVLGLYSVQTIHPDNAVAPHDLPQKAEKGRESGDDRRTCTRTVKDERKRRACTDVYGPASGEIAERVPTREVEARPETPAAPLPQLRARVRGVWCVSVCVMCVCVCYVYQCV